ncbi:MAG: cobalamin biosynthesis protein, partial [Bacteroidales bacterium]
NFATIGLKSEEFGIYEACDYFKANLKIVSDDFVKMVQGKFQSSEFVYKTTGLYAVSEPCGYVASGFGTCLIEKQKCDGITFSIWR